MPCVVKKIAAVPFPSGVRVRFGEADLQLLTAQLLLIENHRYYVMLVLN